MNKVAKNAVWIIACKIVQSVLSFFIGILTARYLGPSNYGLITYAASLTAFFVPIMQLGFANVLVRELVEKPEYEGKTLGTAVLLSVASSGLCIIGIGVIAAISNPGEKVTIVVCCIYSLNLFFQAIDLIAYWYQAHLLSKYTSIVSLIAYVMVSAYKLYLLITHKSVYWFAISNALDSFLIGIAIFVLYYRLGGQRLEFSKKIGSAMFENSKHYIVSSMMVTIFAQTDKIMLKMMMNEAATGLYGAAISIAGITGFVFSAIIDSFRPSIFEGYKASNDIFENRLSMLYAIVIYFSLFQSFFITLVAPFIVRIIYGPAYEPTGDVLRIAIWYTTFAYLGSVRNIWILAKNEQKHLWKINLTGAIANVLLNTILIPSLGINGAALASLVTQFYTNVVTGYILRPIRENNRIMIAACNPRYLMEAVNHMRASRN